MTTPDLLRRNRKVAESILQLIETEKDDRQVVVLTQICAKILSHAHAGMFCCRELEKKGLVIANKYDVPLSAEHKKKSVLHVLTKAYVIGGHTRVVYNWINNAPENEIHSVILLNQRYDAMPDWLRESVSKKKGRIINLCIKNEIARALKLRQVASEYEYVVLHIHPDDFVPVIAFGSSSFKRPVILFNHADHIFWLGISVADIVADLRIHGQNLTLKRRGARFSSILPIPIEKHGLFNRSETRKKLQIPSDKIVLVSIGSPYKYYPAGNYNFIKYSMQILKQNRDAIIYVIGPSPKEKIWRDASKISSSRLKVLGPRMRDEITMYLSAADAYLESFPVPSFTAILEVALSGVPVVPNIYTPIGHCDVFANYSAPIIADSVSSILKNIDADGILIDKISQLHCLPGWRDYLNNLLAKMPLVHSISDMPKIEDGCNEYDKFLSEIQEYGSNRHSIIDFDCFWPLSVKNKIEVLKYYRDLGALNGGAAVEALKKYLRIKSRLKKTLGLSSLMRRDEKC